jgi:ethanolamine transporter EutH
VNRADITVISRHFYTYGEIYNEAELVHVAVSNIKDILLVRKGNIAKGAVVGGSIAFVTGLLVGLIIYEPGHGYSRGQFGLALGLYSMPFGCGVGMLIATSNKKIYQINGNQESFDAVRPKLEERSIRFYLH